MGEKRRITRIALFVVLVLVLDLDLVLDPSSIPACS